RNGVEVPDARRVAGVAHGFFEDRKGLGAAAEARQRDPRPGAGDGVAREVAIAPRGVPLVARELQRGLELALRRRGLVPLRTQLAEVDPRRDPGVEPRGPARFLFHLPDLDVRRDASLRARRECEEDRGHNQGARTRSVIPSVARDPGGVSAQGACLPHHPHRSLAHARDDIPFHYATFNSRRSFSTSSPAWNGLTRYSSAPRAAARRRSSSVDSVEITMIGMAR